MTERAHQLDDATPPVLAADLDTIDFRVPVVDDGDPAVYTRRLHESGDEYFGRLRGYEHDIVIENKRVDRQWAAITEAVRRAIPISPNARHVAAGFVAEPLSERLPGRAVDALAATDERTARLVQLTKGRLGALLDLPVVPDEVITPDIKHAPVLKEREHIARQARYWGEPGSDGYKSTLTEVKAEVAQSPGITKAEKELVARRYGYARDVKMLGLMAELHDQPLDNVVIEDGTIKHQLPSGTKLVMTEQAFNTNPGLLDPSKWQSRRQLKDRVYEISVDGKDFILKERKTPRHTDTKKRGHVDGHTSEEEFRVAREFANLGVIRRGDIELHWEKPLGYVEFPDGFQFCVFESENDMVTDQRLLLEREILARREEYDQEYRQVRERAAQIYRERKDLLSEERLKRFAFSLATRKYKRRYRNQQRGVTGSPNELAFEEFAALKASHMYDEAPSLLTETIAEKGYHNSDDDGYAFRLRLSNGRPMLEIIGFDFEYYKSNTEIAARRIISRRNDNEQGDRAMRKARSVFSSGRAIAQAGSYAMVERRGMKLPPKRMSDENS